jgi:hypothetical protein
LLATDEVEETFWFLALTGCNTELLEQIWRMVKEELNTEKLNKKFLLAKKLIEMTEWQVAAGFGKIQLLKKLWEWAKEVKLNLGENLLLVRHKYEQQSKAVWRNYGIWLKRN